MVLSDYVSSMCVAMAHTTTANRVRNDYNLPMDDEAEATGSSLFCNDVELYHCNEFETEGDSYLPF